MWRWCLLREVGYSLCPRHQTESCRGWCLDEEPAFISIWAYHAHLSTETALRETLGFVKEQVQEGLGGDLAGISTKMAFLFVLMGTIPAQATVLLKARETLNSLLVKPLLG